MRNCDFYYECDTFAEHTAHASATIQVVMDIVSLLLVCFIFYALLGMEESVTGSLGGETGSAVASSSSTAPGQVLYNREHEHSDYGKSKSWLTYPGQNTHPHLICHAEHVSNHVFVMQKMDVDGFFFFSADMTGGAGTETGSVIAEIKEEKKLENLLHKGRHISHQKVLTLTKFGMQECTRNDAPICIA